MTDSERLTVRRTVDVDASRLFEVLVDPARHVEFDTASMVRGVAEGGRIHAVGDRFVMDMHNERLTTRRTTSGRPVTRTPGPSSPTATAAPR